MNSNYIADDGYSENFYVAPIPGVHASIRGEFRPATVSARGRLTERVKRMTDQESDEATAEEVASRIKSWSEAEAPSKASVLGLRPALFRALTGIVMGYIPTDLDPQWPEEEQREYRALIREANEAQEARERIDEKN